jgi:hypothetical protein
MSPRYEVQQYIEKASEYINIKKIEGPQDSDLRLRR